MMRYHVVQHRSLISCYRVSKVIIALTDPALYFYLNNKSIIICLINMKQCVHEATLAKIELKLSMQRLNDIEFKVLDEK